MAKLGELVELACDLMTKEDFPECRWEVAVRVAGPCKAVWFTVEHYPRGHYEAVRRYLFWSYLREVDAPESAIRDTVADIARVVSSSRELV